MRISTSFVLWTVSFAAALPAAAVSLPDFTELVAESKPAVVSIRATTPVRSGLRSGGMDPEAEEFFRRFFGTPPGGGGPGGTAVSTGSGFIISSDGYVMTNHHVVEGASEIIVRLSDQRELAAEVVGTDPETDVALLKVDGRGLPTVRLGSSEELKQGEWVMAIGSPFSFDYTVTAGIVSAKGRAFNADQRYVPFIQTDVAINRGNSGGPLINTRGEVVGINSQILSGTGTFIGISFAIPIEVATDVASQLKDSGRVARGLLGVSIQQVSPELARNLKLPGVGGALVTAVEPDSAADRAGIRPRDVIVSFNGRAVERSSDLPPMVGLTRPGKSAEVGLIRDGERIDVSATIDEAPTLQPVAQRLRPAAPAARQGPLGLSLKELSESERRQLRVDGGVLVTAVVGDAARRAGLATGDVITLVDDEPVRSVADFERTVKALGERSTIALLVHRNGNASFMVIEPESAKAPR